MIATTEATQTTRHSRSRDVRHLPWGSEAMHAAARVGSYIVQEEGRKIGEVLLQGDPEPCGEGWPGCDFRYPNPIPEWRTKHAIACNVHVTGRTTRHGSDIGQYDGWWVRVQIEWVGDCEPSTFSYGWMKVAD